MRVAGADLGTATVKLVVASVTPEGLTVDSADVVAHEGQPLEVFKSLYQRRDLAGCSALGVTGAHAAAIGPPALRLPEDACLEAALGVKRELAGAVDVVTIGAHGYAVLTRDASGRVQLTESDKCSSGAGETMVKMAARFGLELAEADRIARAADRAIPVTARCSVFAKSEMTHHGNQGEPADRLFRGYFESIGRHVAALVARVGVKGPVLLVGGGSRLLTLRDLLARELTREVLVPEEALHFEALGAAALAAEQAVSGPCAALPSSAEPMLRPGRRRIGTLAPARAWASHVTRLHAAPAPPEALTQPSVLGLDIGSTGSKAALTSIETGEMVLEVYDQTRGNPVEAAQRLVRAVLARAAVDVRAAAVTGSGREAVAPVLRAAFPDAEDRIVVLNEIVAHATAAVRCDEAHGKSLSVVEIGGQDAKFIQIAGGQIIESDMNRACSAGTGSFLEEQAAIYGVHDIEDFDRLAQQATSPPDLGQMCTVFVAEAAAEARAEGFSIADIFAGFQYAVIHNYIHRVMGQRRFGDRVFFQGKPASAPSLAWTLAAVTGREVVVPPDPGAMGAWGAGLSALSDPGHDRLRRAPPLDLSRVLAARIVARSDFRCEDRRCATLCTIERATVEIGDRRHLVLSGGACPRYEVAVGARHKLPRDTPDAFHAREQLLEPYLQPSPGDRIVGVPCAGSLVGWLPWAVTFLRELGLGVRVLRSDGDAMSRGEALCSSSSACAPTKVAHGLLFGQVDAVFFPRLLTLPDREGPPGLTCANEQAMPLVIREALRSSGVDIAVVAPAVHLSKQGAFNAALLPLAAAARQLGVPAHRAVLAASRAAFAQARHERELAAIGRGVLAHGSARGLPIVVVCGALHVIFDRAVNAGIPAILRENGALPLPMDCLPIPAGVDTLERVPWADARRALRAALAARATGGLYPLMLSAFGCGPASFVEQIFDLLMAGYPHTVLESDGHGGAAGYVTRIQAFLHGARRHGRGASPVPEERLVALRHVEPPPLGDERTSHLVTFAAGETLGAIAAASYRSLGYDAVAAGPGTAETLALGRRDCSGKECLPHQLIWGGFRQQLESGPPDRRTVLVQVTGQGSCRNCMFSLGNRMSIEHMGLGGRVDVRELGSEGGARAAFLARFWAGTLGWDILRQLCSYSRISAAAAQVDAISASHMESLVACVEQRQPGGTARCLAEAPRHFGQVLDILESASRRLAPLVEAQGAERSRTVLLSGDIYTRIDDFANDGIVRALNERGVRVIPEPAGLLVEHLALNRSAELFGLPTGFFAGAAARTAMRRMRCVAYDRVRRFHPWLPVLEPRRLLEEARPLIDVHPLLEAPITVGSVLHAWKTRMCDGVVVVSPWGCNHAIIAEALLRNRREIPILFVYPDGSPRDDRRLDAFTYRLHRSPPHARSWRTGEQGSAQPG